MLEQETHFSPAKKGPESSQNVDIDLFMQVVGRSPNFSYSTVPHAPDESDATLLGLVDTQTSHDLYQYPWFCRLIIWIYGLTLGLAGNILWLFPWVGLFGLTGPGLVILIRLLPLGSDTISALNPP